MATKLTAAEIKPSTFVGIDSRYSNSQVLYWSDNNLLIFETYKRSKIPVSANDVYTVLKPKYQYRPDLLSYDVYQATTFWWRIMQANNIYDIYDFKAGINIRIPFTLV